MSSVGGVLILYIYPPAIFLKLRFARYRKRARENNVSIRSQYSSKAVVQEILAWCILVAGIILLFLTNYQAVYTIVESGTGNGGLCVQLECRTLEHWNETYFNLG